MLDVDDVKNVAKDDEGQGVWITVVLSDKRELTYQVVVQEGEIVFNPRY